MATNNSTADADFTSFMAMIGGMEDTPAQEENEPLTNDVEADDADDMDAFSKMMNSQEDSGEESEEYEEDEADEDEAEEDDDSEEDYEEEYEESDEAVDVDFDTTITLPNGVEITIEELHGGYKNANEIKALQEELETSKAELEANRANAEKRIALSKLEAERVLEEFRGFDWQDLARKDPEQFANTKLFVEKYAERKQEIEAEYARIEQEKEESKKAEVRVNAQKCLEVLTNDIPEWNQKLYTEILTHGVEGLGIDKDFLVGCTDPGLLKAIHHSMKMKNSADTVRAKVTKKVKAPAKTAKATKKDVKITKKTTTYDPNNEADEFSFFKSMLTK